MRCGRNELCTIAWLGGQTAPPLRPSGKEVEDIECEIRDDCVVTISNDEEFHHAIPLLASVAWDEFLNPFQNFLTQGLGVLHNEELFINPDKGCVSDMSGKLMCHL